MTAEDAFAALAGRIGAYHPHAATFGDDELSRWPAAAVAAMTTEKLLVKAGPAVSVVCPGCEQQCLMPVEIETDGEVSARFVVCDKRSDISRVPIQESAVRQWRSSGEALVRFIAGRLGLRRTATESHEPNLINVGIARGKRRRQMLALRISGEVIINVAGAELPLAELIEFRDEGFEVDEPAIARLVDASRTGDPSYVPSIARNEVRKLDTAELRASWQKAYREERRLHPGKTNRWYAQRIADKQTGTRYAAETIRKHMTK